MLWHTPRSCCRNSKLRSVVRWMIPSKLFWQWTSSYLLEQQLFAELLLTKCHVCVTQVIAPAVRHHTRNSLLHGRMARSIVLQFRYIVQGQILLPNHDIFPRAGKGNLVPHPRRNRCEGGHRRRVDGIIFSQPSEARIGRPMSPLPEMVQSIFFVSLLSRTLTKLIYY